MPILDVKIRAGSVVCVKVRSFHRRRKITAGRENKIRILFHFFQKLYRLLIYGIRCTHKEYTGRIEIAENKDVLSHLRQNICHVYTISKVKTLASGTVHAFY